MQWFQSCGECVFQQRQKPNPLITAFAKNELDHFLWSDVEEMKKDILYGFISTLVLISIFPNRKITIIKRTA